MATNGSHNVNPKWAPWLPQGHQRFLQIRDGTFVKICQLVHQSIIFRNVVDCSIIKNALGWHHCC
jgi:hypothetical protein